MIDTIYFIITIIAEQGLYYPYWGLLCNSDTKTYFESKQKVKLDGYWLYACVKSAKFNIKEEFDKYRLKPDCMWNNDGDMNIWYGWKIGESLFSKSNNFKI